MKKVAITLILVSLSSFLLAICQIEAATDPNLQFNQDTIILKDGSIRYGFIIKTTKRYVKLKVQGQKPGTYRKIFFRNIALIKFAGASMSRKNNILDVLENSPEETYIRLNKSNEIHSEAIQVHEKPVVNEYALKFKTDTIVFENGNEIYGQIKEITSYSISYTGPDTSDQTYNVTLIDKVRLIKYSNGITEVPKKVKTVLSSMDMFKLGEIEAKRYYKGNSSMIVTGAISVIAPPLGIVQGIIASNRLPKINKNRVSNEDYLTHGSYVSGYEQQAKKIKRNKIAKGFGIAFGILAVSFAVDY